MSVAFIIATVVLPPLIERAVQGEYERQAEEFLGCIQEIEGRRVPIDELATHGVRFVFPDGSTAFQWHGVTLLTFPPPFETSPPRERRYSLSLYDHLPAL